MSSSGKLLILGEAWGEAEEREGVPFIGYSGSELTRMLTDAGIHRSSCYLTNVFNQRPPGNDVEFFCGPKDQALNGYPALAGSKYVRDEFRSELERLAGEIRAIKPTVIIALGNTAMWAMLGKTGISKLRGVADVSTHTVVGIKVLPTYHPAAVVRQWTLRPTVVLDFMKALRESEFPELRRPSCEIWLEPTLEDLYAFERYLLDADIISIDIETSGNAITCIGFAPNPRLSLVIPFVDERRADRSYWHTYDAERKAWAYVKRMLELPNRKLFQNGCYDLAFLYRSMGLKVRNAAEDSMLLHHALQPESLKGLGFLGSIYTDHGAWKTMREKTTTIKRDN